MTKDRTNKIAETDNQSGGEKCYMPTIQTDMLNILDRNIEGLNRFVQSIQRLDIYVGLSINQYGKVFLKNFYVNE